MVYTKPYTWLLVLILNDPSNKHLDKGIYKDVATDVTGIFTEQIVLVDLRLWLTEKILYKLLWITVSWDIIHCTVYNMPSSLHTTSYYLKKTKNQQTFQWLSL